MLNGIRFLYKVKALIKSAFLGFIHYSFVSPRLRDLLGSERQYLRIAVM